MPSAQNHLEPNRVPYHLPGMPSWTTALTKQPRFLTRSVLSHCLLGQVIFFWLPRDSAVKNPPAGQETQ